jgi:hypothetical protein
MYNEAREPILTNCILWGNTAIKDGAQIYNNGSLPIVTYCDVQDEYPDDGTIYPGTGNIDDDPCFVDADGPDNISGTDDDNLRLSHDSPCILSLVATMVQHGIRRIDTSRMHSM